MVASLSSSSSLSDADYRRWANHLVGKDWEIFWREEEDREVDEEHLDEKHIGLDGFSVSQSEARASGQETAEEKRKDRASTESENENEAMDVDTETELPSSDTTINADGKDEEIPSSENKEEKEDQNADDDEGSIIDDWYAGHVIEIVDENDDLAIPVGEQGWKFRVTFVGDEEIYELALMPSKIRPSVRGWVQRTVALLNPPVTATGDNKVGEGEEPDLPPDTSTLVDQEHLQSLKAKLVDDSIKDRSNHGLTTDKTEDLTSLPTYKDFRRIQNLRYQLESQIYLRQKLSKIENHSGKELFTDGVRNPTENYVNHLVQCSKDLAQSCSWYCNSWKLLLYYFGNSSAHTNGIETNRNVYNDDANNSDRSGEVEKVDDLGRLTFEQLVTDYLEFGKNTIVNTAMIDINASIHSNKRRSFEAPTAGNSNSRRTKRRRKQSATGTAGHGGADKVLAAASKVDANILSTVCVNNFLAAVSDHTQYRHIIILGNMLRSVSELVVDPLVSWQSLTRRILGENADSNRGHDDGADSLLDRKDVKPTNDSKGAPSSDDDEEMDELFTYEQIQSCLSSLQSNRVLSSFNLFDNVHKLHTKLSDIQDNHTKALTLLQNLGSIATPNVESQEESYSRRQDEILTDLIAILKEMDSPESALYNVIGLSSNDSSSILSREHLAKAIELRSWFADVHHVQSVRERCAFVKGLISKIEPVMTLPDPKEIPVVANLLEISQRRDASIQSILEIQAAIKNCSVTAEERENNFLMSSGSLDVLNATELNSHMAFLQSALKECKEYPVILPFEEKIAARIDLINWYGNVSDAILSRLNWSEKSTDISLSDVKSYFESLQLVLEGSSVTRTNLTKGLEPNSNVNEFVARFVSSDLYENFGEAVDELTKLHTTSASWKKRADAVILSLRGFGNLNAGDPIDSPKPCAMVDIKRVVDLTEEYPKLPIDIHGYIQQLNDTQAEAFRWSQNIYTTLLENNHGSLADTLPFIEKERDERPKGIMVNPNRSVMDAIVDLLAWYGKIKLMTKSAAESLGPSLMQGDLKPIEDVYSALIISDLYPILAEGSEALESYCAFDVPSNDGGNGMKVESSQCLELLGSHFNIRKTPRAPSREKINMNELISSLFSRMASQDESEGFPLLFTLWLQWHLLVAEFVSQLNTDRNSDGRRGHVASLIQAKQLRAQNPFFSVGIGSITDPNIRFLIETKSKEMLDLERYIEEAKSAEATIKVGMTKAKELLRGSLLEKDERIRTHLASIKGMQSLLKDRSIGNGGLSLNAAYEIPLEQHVKYFTWVVKSLQYPVLHEGEASYSSSTNESDANTSRISWDALVSLHDRFPGELSESGNPILCILRVRELYSAAKKWQDEVCRCTMISKRGNKRRGAKTSYQENSTTESETKDTEKDPKIRLQKIELLAEDRILSKVDMPRHKAVKMMLDTSRKFEVELENFLSQDFDGHQDNAPLPRGDSLVGRNGQFILYRLTGSSLFYMMQTSVQSLSEIGDNVFAETRGKVTFDWMSSAVTWIEELQEAVITQAKFTNAKEKILVIPVKDARKLCESGENTFLQSNKDVTRTLSNHGIYVSVNSIKKRLNVRLKKDGAHHSVGGIIIHWCPILFDALRADVLRLESWENDLEQKIDEFETFQASLSDDDTIEEETLFQWYSHGMKIRTALEEGQNSLVVWPTKDAIDTYTSVLGTISNYLDKNCTREQNTRFSKRLFANNASLYNNRFELLDALLYRQKVAESADDESYTESGDCSLEPEMNFRDKCRSSLESALARAAAALSLESEEMPCVEDLCALKAWEIETEMFETLQDDIETTKRVSEDYREKARRLKNNLDNTGNVSLCLKVLLGDIKADALVKMTPDQLANEKAKLEREMAITAALKDKVLTPGLKDVTHTNTSSDTKSLPNPPSVGANPPPGILRNKGTVAEGTPKVQPDDKDVDMKIDEDGDGAPTMDSDDEGSIPSDSKVNSISCVNLSPITNIGPARTRSLPPPPPPSLVSSFNTFPKDRKVHSSENGDRGIRTKNAFGGQSFKIEIQGREKYAFGAAFYQEDRSQAIVDQYMGESLAQKGRSKIDDFHRFVSEKLKGGRWQVTCLRMATINEKDSGLYKEFYKEFEAKERIAMFKLYGDSGSKLFLVTPKFHNVARRIQEISFGNKNSTYAVVLTKKDDGEIWND